MHWLSGYLKEITHIAADGGATEFSYRTAIDNMLRAAAGEFGIAVDILQEPSRVPHIGAPDFRISAKGGGVIGYVECKKPGDNLRKLPGAEQLQKYRALSGNILLTDAWHWALLRDGKRVSDAVLPAAPDRQTKADFADLLRAFMQAPAEKIGDAERLAEALARRCALLRGGLETHAGHPPAQSRLHSLLKDFRTALDADLRFDQFADTFAQTLVYSLLLAKLKAPAGAVLDLYDLNRHIPTNFAVIRDITTFLQDLSDPAYQGIAWVVDDILAVVNGMDAAAVGESMSYRNGGKGFDDGDDPYLYFYENFLAAYDAKQRERRGVYYTPPPVVKFIVRAVDDLLRRDFNLPGGLSETGVVTALDFAAGTGTFMLEMMRSVLAGATPARRDMLTRGHLLKNFHGFELLIAPYAIAHLKLSQFLADNDVPLQDDERINVFLTNTLERVSKQIELPMMPKLADEANRAQSVKDSPVLVITGNPPYSGHSQNKGAWIADLMKTYKQVDGKPLGERNPKWLQDDYVKFIRFAQWKMENVERGIVAVITNHGFLDNPTFRGMRQSLMGAFDALYFLDLHGNAKKKETAPGGGKDENVFDIQQGVAISILVKSKDAKKKGVFHADLYGKRAGKYNACLENSMRSVKWRKVKPASPFYLFVPHAYKAVKTYNRLYAVTDIFSVNSVGIVTARDDFTIGFDKAMLKKRLAQFAGMPPEEARERFDLGEDSNDWNVASAHKDLSDSKLSDDRFRQIAYRPFDVRTTYYTGNSRGFHCRPRGEIMRHMLMGGNTGLITSRRQSYQSGWNSVFAADVISEGHFRVDINYLFPLYFYESFAPSPVEKQQAGIMEDGADIPARRENINPTFRRWLNDRYATAHTPEDILGCIYAVLHSPDYRKRYADFLRTDFPRIPFPDTTAEFTRLAALGNDLIAAHLLRANCAGDLAQHAGTGASHKVEKVRYDEKAERLYFNKDEWFAPLPPDVFTFPIGGYQPLDKYLKSRKTRTLTLPETETLQKAANAIAFTLEKMGEIDK